MIGMEDYSAAGLQDGTIVKAIILSVGPSAAGLADLRAEQETEFKRAAALGTQPKELTYDAKRLGLSVEYAVIEAGENKIVTGYGDALRLPNYSFTGRINQLPLTTVFYRSADLHAAGKEFGYNFQKQGGGNSLSKNDYPVIVNLHPNPNVEKDWDSGVSAIRVPAGEEPKYQGLLDKEANRLDKWAQIVTQWESLSPEDAYSELTQGLSRRMLLMTIPNKKPLYVSPQPGMIFQAKIVRNADSKYFDLAFFGYDKTTKQYNFFVNLEENVSFVLDEETIAMAEQIKDLSDKAKESYRAKQATVATSNNTSDNEWE